MLQVALACSLLLCPPQAISSKMFPETQAVPRHPVAALQGLGAPGQRLCSGVLAPKRSATWFPGSLISVRLSVPLTCARPTGTGRGMNFKTRLAKLEKWLAPRCRTTKELHFTVQYATSRACSQNWAKVLVALVEAALAGGARRGAGAHPARAAALRGRVRRPGCGRRAACPGASKSGMRLKVCLLYAPSSETSGGRHAHGMRCSEARAAPCMSGSCRRA